MSKPRIVFCYRYGLLGGVSAQLLNRFPYLSQYFDVVILYEQDHGMAGQFPPNVARVVPTKASQSQVIRELDPDLLIVIDSPGFIDAWHVAGSPGQLILEVHTTTANVSYLRDPKQFTDVAHFVTVSSFMENLLLQHGLDSIAPVTVVPNCLDNRWRAAASAGFLDGKPLVWVGKLDGHKRWRTAVDLMDQLSEVNDLNLIPIIIGGLTSPESEVRSLTTRLATSKGLMRGVWWPRVEYDRMPALYTTIGSHGGVHLCTSTNESFGMAVAESIMRGCPVVAPSVGALPEILPDAALYEPDDWIQAKEKTHRALTDSGFREELLSSADRVSRLTDPKTVVSVYHGLLNALLDGKRF